MRYADLAELQAGTGLELHGIAVTPEYEDPAAGDAGTTPPAGDGGGCNCRTGATTGCPPLCVFALLLLGWIGRRTAPD